MNWAYYHSKSEEFASRAESALKRGDDEDAIKYYLLAGEAEEKALSFIEQGKNRTLGITAVSAASLYYKGENYRQAEHIAYQYLSNDMLPSFARSELKSILQRIWVEAEFKKSGIEFVRGEVLVSVGGGIIGSGIAPLDLIHRKMDEVRNIFYRVIELILNRPFRRRGAPSIEIHESFRPWLIQAPAGSYQFAVRIEKPAQLPLFPDGMPKVQEVTQKFFEVLNATSKGSDEELEKLVPNLDYRESFLKLTRNLAPTGKSFERVEIKSAIDKEATPIIFIPDSRRNINQSLKTYKKPDDELGHREAQLTGILRALHLDKDWIEINIPEDNRTIKIHKTGDVIDDIVGPMVNQRIIVDVSITSDGKYIFRDIQSED